MDERILREKLDARLVLLKQELQKLRISRASVELVEDLPITAYETTMPLKQIASISTPEPRSLLVQPWDKNLIPAIEKAVRQSYLHLNPVVDGGLIRIIIPPLTEESRRDVVKILHKTVEEARIAVRKIRENAMEEIDWMEKNGEISEDEKFRRRDITEKIVGEHNQKMREIEDTKEKEILEI